MILVAFAFCLVVQILRGATRSGLPGNPKKATRHKGGSGEGGATPERLIPPLMLAEFRTLGQEESRPIPRWSWGASDSPRRTDTCRLLIRAGTDRNNMVAEGGRLELQPGATRPHGYQPIASPRRFTLRHARD